MSTAFDIGPAEIEQNKLALRNCWKATAETVHVDCALLHSGVSSPTSSCASPSEENARATAVALHLRGKLSIALVLVRLLTCAAPGGSMATPTASLTRISAFNTLPWRWCELSVIVLVVVSVHAGALGLVSHRRS